MGKICLIELMVYINDRSNMTTADVQRLPCVDTAAHLANAYFFLRVMTAAGTRAARITNPTAAEEPQPFLVSGAVVSGDLVVTSGAFVAGSGALVVFALVVVGFEVTGAAVVSASVVSTTGSSPLKPYAEKSG